MSEKTYNLNLETSKIELHFTKQEYEALTELQKQYLKRAYIFSNSAGAWVSRSTKNHYSAIETAKELGFTEGEKIGQRLSYEEQLDRKAEKSENRAERYIEYAHNAASRGSQLQSAFNRHRGDIAFLTQPNVNSSGGRAFTNYRNRIVDRFERGFEEYRKSEYFRQKAVTAGATASMKQLQDKVYLDNRIKEMNAVIKKLQARIVTLEARNSDSDNPNEEKLIESLEQMEYEMDKLAFFKNKLDELGGIQHDNSNIKPGYYVKIRGRWDLVKKANPKTVETISQYSALEIKYPYSEIQDVKIPDGWVEEKDALENPFKVDDIVVGHYIGSDKISRAYQVIKATNKTVTIRRIDVKDSIPIPNVFASEKLERRSIKKDRSGNVVINDTNWYLYHWNRIAIA
jgi:Predicted membrane protein